MLRLFGKDWETFARGIGYPSVQVGAISYVATEDYNVTHFRAHLTRTRVNLTRTRARLTRTKIEMTSIFEKTTIK